MKNKKKNPHQLLNLTMQNQSIKENDLKADELTVKTSSSPTSASLWSVDEEVVDPRKKHFFKKHDIANFFPPLLLGWWTFGG